MDRWMTGGDASITADATITMMMLEMSAIDSRKQAIVREMVEVPYDANDL